MCESACDMSECSVGAGAGVQLHHHFCDGLARHGVRDTLRLLHYVHNLEPLSFAQWATLLDPHNISWKPHACLVVDQESLAAVDHLTPVSNHSRARKLCD